MTTEQTIAHTSGPWTLSEEFSSSPSGKSYRSNAITANGKLLGRAQGFSEANARLSAAAPIGHELATQVMAWANACPSHIVQLASQFLQQAEGVRT